MKKRLLFLLMLCYLPFFAQMNVATHIGKMLEKQTAFLPIAPFRTVKNRDPIIDKLVRKASFAQLDREIARSVFLERPDHIELSLPYEGTTITMLLYRVEIAGEDFHISTNRIKNIAYTPGAYYRGIIKNNSNSVAAFSFFEGEIYGIVSAPGKGNTVVGRIDVTGNTKDYVIYSDADLVTQLPLTCTTPDTPATTEDIGRKDMQLMQSQHCVTLYFELRYNAYQANGYNVTQTVNWFTALFNNVHTLFDNDGITTSLKSVYVWESEDPYDMGTPSAYDLLDQFAANTPVFDADAGQLINYGGGNGLAYNIGALCSHLNRSYAKVNPYYQPLPAYSFAVKIMAHELGHTLGSQHTHGCYWNGNNTAIDGCSTPEGDCPAGPIPTNDVGATIMSYCGNINFANGFGQQPKERILQHIAASQCLGSDCINSCTSTVRALRLTDASLTTATLTWDDADSTIWEMGYAPFGNSITNWQEVTQNTFILENLQSHTYYTFSVRNQCTSNAVTGIKTLSFSTGADWCNGAVWTDTGGTQGHYSEEQHTVTIIKPAGEGQAVTVSFEDFFSQLQDVLYIYDGIGTAGPLLGSWSGYSAPSVTYVATNPTGALTFEFITDMGTAPSEGWEATVDCALMDVNDLSFSTLSYFPNPVTESLSVNLPTGLDSIAIYNLAGQLLVHKKIGNTSCVIDMQSYASGMYIVKMRSGTNTNHIKIIKQ